MTCQVDYILSVYLQRAASEHACLVFHKSDNSWVTSMIIKSVKHYIKGEFDPEEHRAACPETAFSNYVLLSLYVCCSVSTL